MYFAPGWQEKSMQVRTLHAVGVDLQDMTLIPPAKSSREKAIQRRVFRLGKSGFPRLEDACNSCYFAIRAKDRVNKGRKCI
jgi:hypothetical protein